MVFCGSLKESEAFFITVHSSLQGDRGQLRAPTLAPNGLDKTLTGRLSRAPPTAEMTPNSWGSSATNSGQWTWLAHSQLSAALGCDVIHSLDLEVESCAANGLWAHLHWEEPWRHPDPSDPQVRSQGPGQVSGTQRGLSTTRKAPGSPWGLGFWVGSSPSSRLSLLGWERMGGEGAEEGTGDLKQAAGSEGQQVGPRPGWGRWEVHRLLLRPRAF